MDWKFHTFYYLPPYEVAECLLVGMVNGTYQELSTKNNIKSVIERFEQHMPAGMKWNKFLRNGKNEEELTNIIMKFIKYDKGQQLFNSSFFVIAKTKSTDFKKIKTKLINEIMRCWY